MRSCFPLQIVMLAFILSSGLVGALEPVAQQTYFLRIRPGKSPVNILRTSSEINYPRKILSLQAGEVVRIQIGESEFKVHSARCATCGEWIDVGSMGFDKNRIWLQPDEADWIDAYSNRVILTSRQNEVRIFPDANVASWQNCKRQLAFCVAFDPKSEVIELVETRIVADNPLEASACRLFYKVHLSKVNSGGWREGWVLSEDFAIDSANAVEQSRAPALLEDLLRTRGTSEMSPLGIVPGAAKVRRYHWDFSAQAASFALKGENVVGVGQDNLASGAELGAFFLAPLVEDFSTNLFVRYGYAMNSQRGTTARFSAAGFGDEIIYNYSPYFHFGLGGKVLVFNNAPAGSFRVLAGGMMSFLFERDRFFGSYRGGPVANTATGISFSNYEILVSLGWHLDNDRHGWSLIGTYDTVRARTANTTENMQYTVITAGLQSGF